MINNLARRHVNCPGLSYSRPISPHITGLWISSSQPATTSTQPQFFVKDDLSFPLFFLNICCFKLSMTVYYFLRWEGMEEQFSSFDWYYNSHIWIHWWGPKWNSPKFNVYLVVVTNLLVYILIWLWFHYHNSYIPSQSSSSSSSLFF